MRYGPLVYYRQIIEALTELESMKVSNRLAKRVVLGCVGVNNDL